MQAVDDSSSSPLPQSNLQDSGIPPDAVPVGIAFMDPMFGMAVVINNIEWTFYRERNTNQVYFFNHINPSDYNIISISAVPFSGDTDQESTRLWSEMRENHRRSPIADDSFVYQDRQAIPVGEDGQYPGYLYSFEARQGDNLLIFNALFWSAGDMMYTCTTSAMEQDAEEVQNVLDGLLESFVSMPTLTPPDATPTPPADSGVSVTVDGQSINWVGGAEPFLDGAEILLPLKRIIRVLGGTYLELESHGEQRIVFTLDSKMLLVILGSREYATNDLIEIDGGFTFGESRSYFLNAAPIVMNGDVFFPLSNFSDAMGLEIRRVGDSVDFL